MHFDGALADLEIERHHFVWPALHQPVENFALASGQRVEAAKQVIGSFAASIPPLCNGECALHARDQRFVGEWFFDEVRCAGLHRLDDDRHLGIGRHHDDRDPIAPPVEFALDGKPVEPGQPQFEQHDIPIAQRCFVEKPVALFVRANVAEAGKLQKHPNKLAGAGIIIDDEYCRLHGHAFAPRPRQAR